MAAEHLLDVMALTGSIGELVSNVLGMDLAVLATVFGPRSAAPGVIQVIGGMQTCG